MLPGTDLENKSGIRLNSHLRFVFLISEAVIQGRTGLFVLHISYTRADALHDALKNTDLSSQVLTTYSILRIYFLTYT